MANILVVRRELIIEIPVMLEVKQSKGEEAELFDMLFVVSLFGEKEGEKLGNYIFFSLEYPAHTMML